MTAQMLKPCPFCGSEPLVNHIEPHSHGFSGMPDHPGSCVIECGCGAGLLDDTEELVTNRWNTRAEEFNAQSEKAPEPAELQITKQQAYDMGAKGGPVVEAERELFEEWMRGHCWAVSGTWNGTSYIGYKEDRGSYDPHAAMTRQLWAVWRDRAALGSVDATMKVKP